MALACFSVLCVVPCVEAGMDQHAGSLAFRVAKSGVWLRWHCKKMYPAIGRVRAWQLNQPPFANARSRGGLGLH